MAEKGTPKIQDRKANEIALKYLVDKAVFCLPSVLSVAGVISGRHIGLPLQLNRKWDIYFLLPSLRTILELPS